MKLRSLKKRAPKPREFNVAASVVVPEYTGPLGLTMNTVRLRIKFTRQGNPDHRDCMRQIHAARERYLAGEKALAKLAELSRELGEEI